MELEYTYWQNGNFFVEFLNDYPEDSTQGVSLAELEEALTEIYEIKQEEKNILRKYENPRTHEYAQIPRHSDINEFTAMGILKKLSK
jgi:hypothetical protein